MLLPFSHHLLPKLLNKNCQLKQGRNKINNKTSGVTTETRRWGSDSFCFIGRLLKQIKSNIFEHFF